MIEVRVIDGRLNLFIDDFLHYKIGSGNIRYAEVSNNEKLILVTENCGRVELRDISGKFIRNIGNGDTSIAKWLGDHITLVNKKGVSEYKRITNLSPFVL